MLPAGGDNVKVLQAPKSGEDGAVVLYVSETVESGRRWTPRKKIYSIRIVCPNGIQEIHKIHGFHCSDEHVPAVIDGYDFPIDLMASRRQGEIMALLLDDMRLDLFTGT